MICPYELLSDYFTKEQWNDIENREKWITFASYPEKSDDAIRVIRKEQIEKMKKIPKLFSNRTDKKILPLIIWFVFIVDGYK